MCAVIHLTVARIPLFLNSKFESNYSRVTFTRFGQQICLQCKYFDLFILKFYKIISYLILLTSYHFFTLLPPQMSHHVAIRHLFAECIRGIQKTRTVFALALYIMSKPLQIIC